MTVSSGLKYALQISTTTNLKKYLKKYLKKKYKELKFHIVDVPLGIIKLLFSI